MNTVTKENVDITKCNSIQITNEEWNRNRSLSVNLRRIYSDIIPYSSLMAGGKCGHCHVRTHLSGWGIIASKRRENKTDVLLNKTITN